jgi:hypothetical protein
LAAGPDRMNAELRTSLLAAFRPALQANRRAEDWPPYVRSIQHAQAGELIGADN